MFNLIKKDYLIVKKVWLGTMVIAVLIPAFLSSVAGDMNIPAGITLTVMSTLLAVILFSSIDEEEEKYPKAAALMSTIGYSREIQVIKRFVLMLIVFLYSAIVYFVESLLITELGGITIMSLAISILVFTIIASLYLALTTLLGLRAGRYIVMFVILLISLGPTIISKLNVKIHISFIDVPDYRVLSIIMIALSGIIYFSALKISIKAYNKKEL